MMSKRYAQAVVLTEDKQQRAFVTRLLQKLSYKNELRVLPLPAGQGSGEQYVREQYALQVHEVRRRSTHLKLALVVAIDANSGEVMERQRQLAVQLKAAEQEPRDPDERIVHLIPRRNIETWIWYLMGQQVNETDTYQRLKLEGDCQRAVNRLAELYRSSQPLPEGCPPSLVAALDELQRLARS
jgi:hypothetical protein